jgi:hypothetical protein
VSASPLGARTSGALIIRHTDWERAPPARSSPAPACASGNHPAPLVPAPSGGGLGWGRVGIPPGIARLQCSHRNWERAPPAHSPPVHYTLLTLPESSTPAPSGGGLGWGRAPAPSGGGLGWGRVCTPWERAPPARSPRVSYTLLILPESSTPAPPGVVRGRACNHPPAPRRRHTWDRANAGFTTCIMHSVNQDVILPCQIATLHIFFYYLESATLIPMVTTCIVDYT